MTMRKLGLMTVVVAVVSSNPVFAQDWIEYANQEDRFSINFPHEPTVADIEYEAETGQLAQFVAPVTARLYSAAQGDTRHALTVVNYTQVDHVTTLRGTVAHAANHYRKIGEVTFEGYAHIDRVDGHEFQITKEDGRRLFVSIHFHYPVRRLYIVESEVPAGRPPPAIFQAALQFLDEEGNAIRYDIDENGNSSRAR